MISLPAPPGDHVTVDWNFVGFRTSIDPAAFQEPFPGLALAACAAGAASPETAGWACCSVAYNPFECQHLSEHIINIASVLLN